MLIVFTSGHRGLFASSRQSYADTGFSRGGSVLPSLRTQASCWCFDPRDSKSLKKELVRSAFTARMLVIKLHYQTQVQVRKPKDVRVLLVARNAHGRKLLTGLLGMGGTRIRLF